MADRCPTDVYYEFHGMEQRNYNPIEIARRYAPKFDKPVVDAVEVVRCKDCKHQERIAGYSDYQPNTVFCNKWEHLTDIQGHCYKGERKDEVEE